MGKRHENVWFVIPLRSYRVSESGIEPTSRALCQPVVMYSLKRTRSSATANARASKGLDPEGLQETLKEGMEWMRIAKGPFPHMKLRRISYRTHRLKTVVSPTRTQVTLVFSSPSRRNRLRDSGSSRSAASKTELSKNPASERDPWVSFVTHELRTIQARLTSGLYWKEKNVRRAKFTPPVPTYTPLHRAVCDGFSTVKPRMARRI